MEQTISAARSSCQQVLYLPNTPSALAGGARSGKLNLDDRAQDLSSHTAARGAPVGRPGSGDKLAARSVGWAGWIRTAQLGHAIPVDFREGSGSDSKVEEKVNYSHK